MKHRTLPALIVAAAVALSPLPITSATGAPTPPTGTPGDSYVYDPTPEPLPARPTATDAQMQRMETTSESVRDQVLRVAQTRRKLSPLLSRNVSQACVGDGTDGARVQMLYVREQSTPDSFFQFLPYLREEAQIMDNDIALSAHRNGGEGRRIRWVTNPDCSVSVERVVVPDGVLYSRGEFLTDELASQGWYQPNRKYVIYSDISVEGSSCGQGRLYTDSRPASHPEGNLNDGRNPQYALVELPCWFGDAGGDGSSGLHELAHAMGAVQSDAPRATPYGHCYTDRDLLCYADDGGEGTRLPDCPDREAGSLLDCHGDTYFHTNPAEGSYLATHWNLADSAFLEVVPALTDAPRVELSVSDPAPEAEDTVVITASVDEGTRLRWPDLNTPGDCKNPAGSVTGTTFTLQCADPTDFARDVYAERDDTPLRTRTRITVPFSSNGTPTLSLNVPPTGDYHRPFQVSANLANTKADWTYRWDVNDECTLSAPTAASTTVTCTGAADGDRLIFNLRATRTMDGRELFQQASTQLSKVGFPVVDISGERPVRVGQDLVLTAEVSNAYSPTYQWSLPTGWAVGRTDGRTVTVRPPATLTGDVTGYATLRVTGSNGVWAEKNTQFPVITPLDVTITGPPGGRIAQTFTVRALTRPGTTVTWASDTSKCAVTPRTDSTYADVLCSSMPNKPGWGPFVFLTARATNGTETATDTLGIYLEPAVVTKKATRLTYSVSGTRMSAQLSLLTGAKVTGSRNVALEYRPTTSSTYTRVRLISLSSTGYAAWTQPITKAGYYRVRFGGDSSLGGSTSTARLLKIPTRLTQAKVSGGIQATLKTTSGAALARRNVILQQASGNRWVKVRGFTTTSKGTVRLRLNPPRKTVYRWVFPATSSHAGATSGKVTLY